MRGECGGVGECYAKVLGSASKKISLLQASQHKVRSKFLLHSTKSEASSCFTAPSPKQDPCDICFTSNLCCASA